MPPSYDIHANIYDISVVKPKKEDIFLVDTNVWFWMTYPTATHTATHYQTISYPNFLNDILNVGATLLRINLSLAELSHIIETTEHEIYSNYVKKISLKEYRHNFKEERQRIVSNINTCWQQVESFAASLELKIEDCVATSALTNLNNVNVDGYDLFIIEAMKNSGIVKFITDDGDFSTVPNIDVYTANRNVVGAARSQGKLFRS